MKKIVIIGSTGSIGVQTLEVCSSNSNEFDIYAITAGENTEKLETSQKSHKFPLAVECQRSTTTSSDERSTADATTPSQNSHGIFFEGSIYCKVQPAWGPKGPGPWGPVGPPTQRE